MLTLWCLFGSPLMLGAEMTLLDDWTLSLLTNREVLAMLTPKCRPRQLELDEKKAVWKAYNPETGHRYVALFNLSEETSVISVEVERVDLTACDELAELWTGEKKILKDDCLRAEVPPHGCVVYKK